jgi:nitronate monooxygenase
MLLDALELPVVGAPLAGGPSTPRLAAAVSDAGGLGFVAFGYLSAAGAAEALQGTRALTGAPIGVNVFCPGHGPAAPADYAAYLDVVRTWAQARGSELGTPRYSDDGWAEKLELLEHDPAEVVSFTFGCPSPETMRSLKAAGSETWVTITTPAEAEQAAAAGADALVVQGVEAGGHRASFTDGPEQPQFGLLALLALTRAVTDLPLVAAGGISSGRSLAAALVAGADAAQIGTALMLCPEAGTSAVHREALKSKAPTELTRAFTGRLARGIRNEFMVEHRGAPAAYPELHYATAPLRKHAREAGEAQSVNLWAGESHELALELPAAEVVRGLAAEAREVLAAAAASGDAETSGGQAASPR